MKLNELIQPQIVLEAHNPYEKFDSVEQKLLHAETDKLIKWVTASPKFQEAQQDIENASQGYRDDAIDSLEDGRSFNKVEDEFFDSIHNCEFRQATELITWLKANLDEAGINHEGFEEEMVDAFWEHVQDRLIEELDTVVDPLEFPDNEEADDD